MTRLSTPPPRPAPPGTASARTAQTRTASAGTAPSHDAPSSAAVSFALCGEIARPASLTVADLRTRYPQRRADVIFDCATSGPRHHIFEGPLLREVAVAAGPAFDARRRKDRSRFLLAVSGGDGHRTLLSWAEIDADFGDVPVLLAATMDGRSLASAGSQLVVPSDRCGARSVSAISRVWIGACQEY